jgi:hypothetical protein
MDNLAELKKRYEGWESKILVSRTAYLVAKNNVRNAERDLKLAKQKFNQCYRDWTSARKEAVRAKRRFKTYPRNVRVWAKNNFGTVWDLLEHGDKT